jgi:tripartite-type tricarboxylate transporter receptor subunit TctC
VRTGTVGAGSVGDFTVQIINSLAGVEMTMVPFKGASPAITALRGGHVEGVAVALGAVSAQLKTGAMRGVAISSKFPEFPDIPTMAELGYQQNLLGVWLAFFAPAGVPAEVTAALVPAIEKVSKDPAIAARLAELGMLQDYAPPEKLIEEIREEHRSVEQIAKRAGLAK